MPEKNLIEEKVKIDTETLQHLNTIVHKWLQKKESKASMKRDVDSILDKWFEKIVSRAMGIDESWSRPELKKDSPLGIHVNKHLDGLIDAKLTKKMVEDAIPDLTKNKISKAISKYVGDQFHYKIEQRVRERLNDRMDDEIEKIFDEVTKGGAQTLVDFISINKEL